MVKLVLKVQETCTARGINQAELIRRTGIRQATIHNIWHNKQAERLPIEPLEKIAEVLSLTDIRELIDFEITANE